jgi:hypothetical protein
MWVKEDDEQTKCEDALAGAVWAGRVASLPKPVRCVSINGFKGDTYLSIYREFNVVMLQYVL